MTPLRGKRPVEVSTVLQTIARVIVFYAVCATACVLMAVAL